MPQFASRDFTDQYISTSYQDVLQQYIPNTGSAYILDGVGNVVFQFSASALGRDLITSDLTASMTVLSSSYAVTASFALNAGGGSGTTLFTGSTYQITASWAINTLTSSLTLLTQSNVAISASWASQSFAAFSAISSSWASASISSSYALTASFALNAGGGSGTTLSTGSTYQITSSWAISSIFSNTSSYSIFAEIAGTSSLSANAITASFALNGPFTTLFTASTYQITSSWANDSLRSLSAISASWASSSISSSYAITASFVDASGFSALVIPLQFTYKNSISSADPGKGNFRYNSLTSGSITEIYIDQFTGGGLDVSGIIDSLRSGSYRLYIQQKNDATKASLFSISNAVVDNTGWFTIPVVHISSADNGLPINNSDCAFYIINRNSIVDGNTYNITASWSITSSYSLFAVSSSYSATSSITLITQSNAALSASWASQSFYSVSSSWASSSLSSSVSVSSSYAVTSSYLIYPSSLVSVAGNATTSFILQTSSINNGIFINYTMNDGGNFRAGNVVVLYNTNSVNLAETTTTDIGNSSGLTIQANISNTFVTVSAVNNTSNNFNIKYHYDVL